MSKEDKWSRALKRMLQDIENEVRYTRSMIGREALSERVIEAVKRVPRHKFVDGQLKSRAYDNNPLPIGSGQTISQPYIVALMTDLAEIDPDDKVLEVGTGSGYQTAVLAELAKHVFSIEIVPELAETAKKRLQKMGYENINTRRGDGYHGWPEEAPFDAILVTAAAENIPPPLLEQLKPGGRLVIPVGAPYATQELLLVKKDEKGDYDITHVLPVAFVPLTGEH